jgi:sensor histidine kinase YesM
LPAGEYRLHVRGTNAKGVVSDELTLKITVKQAFYKTWWFIGIVLLFLGWVIWNIFRFRLKREREKAEREKLEYSSRLLTLEQKSLNASMNRHFIFNSLNSIQYYINTQDKRSANKFLTNFAKLIRKNLDSSEEGNLVSLQEEIDRLILYCSLESMRFNNRFEFNLHVDPQIDTELVILPAMLLQPFIENSIIHGVLPVEDRMCKIDVYMTIEHGVLNIQIDDDGLGVDYSKSIKKETTYTHQSQGVEISAKRVELLQKLSGKQMSIEGPFQLNGEHNKSKGTRVIVKIQL